MSLGPPQSMEVYLTWTQVILPGLSVQGDHTVLPSYALEIERRWGGRESLRGFNCSNSGSWGSWPHVTSFAVNDQRQLSPL
jgi:hypothetical protein